MNLRACCLGPKALGYVVSVVIGLVTAAPAWGYVEIPYTLGRVISEATNIVVMKVDKVNVERRLIYYVKVADLKGTHPTDKISHQIQNGFHPREPKTIMDWAKPGKMAIFFHNGGASETCLGDYWYQCYPGSAQPWWSMTHSEPFLAWAYFGSVERLEGIVRDILAGKEVTVPCAQFDHKLVNQHKTLMHERKAPLWRMKASLRLLDHGAMVREPQKYIVGLGAAGPEAIPDMVKRLSEGQLDEKITAAEELGGFGREGKPALTALTAAMRAAEKALRVKATEAVFRIDPGHGNLLGAVEELLKDSDPAVCRLGVEIASEMPRDQTRGLLEHLKRHLTGTDSELSKATGAMLAKWGADGVPLLSDGLRHANPEVRMTCLANLADTVGKSNSVAEAVIACVGDNDPGVRWQAMVTLKVLGQQAAPALGAAVKQLTSGDREARLAAVNLLAAIGPKAEPAVEALSVMVKADSSGTVRRDAATALANIGGTRARAAAPAILANLSDPLIRDRDIRTYRAVFAAAYGRLAYPTTEAAVALISPDQIGLGVAQLFEGGSQVSIETGDKRFGSASLRVEGQQAHCERVPGWNFAITENPKPGEFRYIRFAWKKVGDSGMMLQLCSNGDWNRRYVGGKNATGWTPAVSVSDRTPRDWIVVTRDLYADFNGPFTLTGLSVAPMTGRYGQVNGVVLGRTMEDLNRLMPAN